jgi:hypothetical protein
MYADYVFYELETVNNNLQVPRMFLHHLKVSIIRWKLWTFLHCNPHFVVRFTWALMPFQIVKNCTIFLFLRVFFLVLSSVREGFFFSFLLRPNTKLDMFSGTSSCLASLTLLILICCLLKWQCSYWLPDFLLACIHQTD